MWTFPKTDLKYRLTLQVIAISALSLAVASAYFVIDAERSVRARIDAVADLTAKTLELQQNKVSWVSNPQREFPDLPLIAASVMAPGLCIAYRANTGNIVQRLCGGSQSEVGDPPRAFAIIYRKLFDPGREAVRPVLFRGGRIGDAIASIDPNTLMAEAWRDTGRLIAVLAIALTVLSGLVYAALARALRPTRIVRSGLARLAANDLSVRLPPFDLAELSAVGDVFNHLAGSLDGALRERNELTRRLIALQDDERRHLALELHDEFGQSLAAIRALAASAQQSAVQDCPALLPECDGIARTATEMMESLRGALLRLRPPDVEELGLAASLEGLIAGWNRRSRGRTHFEIALSERFENLSAEIGANLYRVAQEATTNAAKHASASRVRLCLTARLVRPSNGDRGDREIELVVEDDGRLADRPVKSGMGLLGMRERVASLGGRLSFEAGPKGGSVLQVVIPVAADANSGRQRAATTELAA
jgi:signal transduction histidine kinase